MYLFSVLKSRSSDTFSLQLWPNRLLSGFPGHFSSVASEVDSLFLMGKKNSYFGGGWAIEKRSDGSVFQSKYSIKKQSNHPHLQKAGFLD